MTTRDGAVRIRVYGEPRPFPKKEVGLKRRPGQNPHLMPIDRDYRTRKNPTTGKIEKYDRGYMRRWADHVRDTVLAFMMQNGLQPFPANHPVAFSALFFLTKPKTNKRIVPAQTPDEDNLDYAIRNALKRTPAKRVRGHQVEGPHPNGILFYDDDQIVWGLWPRGKLWATEKEPPGVLITVQDFYQIHGDLGEYDPCPDYAKQGELIHG